MSCTFYVIVNICCKSGGQQYLLLDVHNEGTVAQYLCTPFSLHLPPQQQQTDMDGIVRSPGAPNSGIMGSLDAF